MFKKRFGLGQSVGPHEAVLKGYGLVGQALHKVERVAADERALLLQLGLLVAVSVRFRFQSEDFFGECRICEPTKRKK